MSYLYWIACLQLKALVFLNGISSFCIVNLQWFIKAIENLLSGL